MIGEKGTEGILMVGTWLGFLFNVFFNDKVFGVECILRFNLSRVLYESVAAKSIGIAAVSHLIQTFLFGEIALELELP